MTTSRDDMRERLEQAALRDDDPATIGVDGPSGGERQVVLDVLAWLASREPRHSPLRRSIAEVREALTA
jgi:hypothetical protein